MLWVVLPVGCAVRGVAAVVAVESAVSRSLSISRSVLFFFAAAVLFCYFNNNTVVFMVSGDMCLPGN